MNSVAIERVVLASGNAGKLQELQQMLAVHDIAVISQGELQIEDVEETGLTFIENSILKARHACRESGLPSIADDSGLAVDALGGAPGIYSARYAGAGADDAANNRKLLDALRDVPESGRSACFHCVIVFMLHAEDPTPLVCHGRWPGRILQAPAGDQGFGYDPLFLVPEHNCSSAQLPRELKNRISHRGQAMQQLQQLMQLREQQPAGNTPS